MSRCACKRPFGLLGIVLRECVEHRLVLTERHLPDDRVAHGDVADPVDRRACEFDELQDLGQACGTRDRCMEHVVVENRGHRIVARDRTTMRIVDRAQLLDLVELDDLGRAADARRLEHAPDQRTLDELLALDRATKVPDCAAYQHQLLARELEQRFAYGGARNAERFGEDPLEDHVHRMQLHRHDGLADHPVDLPDNGLDRSSM